MTAPCPYAHHREHDWRLPVGNPLSKGLHFSCGICHPPTWTFWGRVCFLDTREEGIWHGHQRIVIEWRRDTSDGPATVRELPTGGPMRKLIRPSSRPEAETFARDLAQAFEELGIARGEPFVVMALPDPAQATLMDNGHKPGNALLGE